MVWQINNPGKHPHLSSLCQQRSHWNNQTPLNFNLEGRCKLNDLLAFLPNFILNYRVAFLLLSSHSASSPLTSTARIILWHTHPLLGNDLLNTFPQEPTCATIGCLLLGNGSVNTPKTIQDNRRWRVPWDLPQGSITRSLERAVSCQKLREVSWRRVNLR
jgi:hypothetical protein